MALNLQSNDLAALGYVSATIAFAVVGILFLRQRETGGSLSRWIALACVVSALSSGVLALLAYGLIHFGFLIVVVEWAKYVAWIAALFLAWRGLNEPGNTEQNASRFALLATIVGVAALTVYVNSRLESVALSLVISGAIAMALIVIVLVEKIVRSVSPDAASGIKYVWAALIVMAAYDIVLFLSTSSSARAVADFWSARGFVNLLVALPIGIAAGRTSFELVIDTPRPAPIRSLSLVLIGGFIGLWIIADFFVTTFGMSWSNVATIVLVMAVILMASTVLISHSARGRARVYLTKVFFRYKYDYRKEWLRFIGVLSESGLENVPRTAVRAVAPIVNSPGGIVWTQEDQGDVYLPIGAWRCDLPVSRSISPDSSLIRFLRDRQWVVDLNELKAQPKRYGDLQLDPWFTEQEEFWLIVPLMIGQQLLGLIVLLRPKVVPTLNFEDHDLLRTVGRHVATHIRQAESDRRLAETSQFGTYHRLSAFLMHDLNNLIAQQSLVVKNAEKFRHNPKFVDDTIDTIAASVSRMRRLMEQLSRNSTAPTKRRVSVHKVIGQAVSRSEPRQPAPVLELGDADARLDADPERLTGIIEHLIRNAQDATDPDGRIGISTGEEGGMVVIRIEDNGCGMSPEFVSERLFRPFDSTKGSQSMGIGAFQAREYARTLGGYLEVTSEVGKGTTFILRLPAANDNSAPD